MRKYGRKEIVGRHEFVEGQIVESKKGNVSEVVCRRYYKSQGETLIGSEKPIDIFSVVKERTANKQMQNIEKQIGIKDFYIRQEIVDVLKN